MRAFFTLIAAGLGFAALCGATLAWDGSALAFQTLDTRAVVTPHDRLIHALLQAPVLLAGQLTDNVAVLELVFSLAYAAVPLLALAACWWVVRDQAPALMVWPTLGIAIGTLPGQLMFTGEAKMAVQLAWPLLLAVLLGLQRRHLPLVMALSATLYFTHPFAIALFALAAVFAGAVGFMQRSEQSKAWLWAVIFGVLSLLTALRLWLLQSPHELEQLSVDVVGRAYGEAVAGLPLLGLSCAWLSAAGLLVALLARRAMVVRASAAVGLGALAAAGAVFLFWASSPRWWEGGLSYKTWVLFCSLPFILMAAAHQLAPRAAAPRTRAAHWTQARQMIQLAGALFALVLAVQSTAWFTLTGRLRETLHASQWLCLSMSTIGDLRTTPLNHWSITTRSLLLQGRAPEKVVLPGDGCGETRFAEGVRVDQNFVHQRAGGWFDLGPLSAKLVAEQETPQGCSFALTSGWHATESDGAYWWRWSDGRDAQLVILVSQETTGLLRGQIESLQQPNEIALSVNGAPQPPLEVTEPGLQPFGPLALPLEQGKNVIRLTSANPARQVDGRLLALDVSNLTLVAADQARVCQWRP